MAEAASPLTTELLYDAFVDQMKGFFAGQLMSMCCGAIEKERQGTEVVEAIAHIVREVLIRLQAQVPEIAQKAYQQAQRFIAEDGGN